MNKLCLIYNFAPRYREGIFRLIDQEYDCDWYFGNNTSDIKGLDFSILKKYSMLKNKELGIGAWYYQKGASSLISKKDVDNYFILGDIYCLSSWLILLKKCLFYRHKKVYVWTHGWYGRESFLKRTMKKLYYSMVNGTFVYGNYAKNVAIEQGFDKNKLFVIHNSLDYSKQTEIRRDLSICNIYKSHFNNDCHNLIFIGRLTGVKRLDMLINAVAQLKAKGKPFNLTFVGDGVQRANLEALAKEKQLEDQVWFYGACYDEKVNAELIYNADLCVAPGNVGLTAMHTMVFGCPVVTHDDFTMQMPEFESIKPGITGDFFKYGNEEDLCKTIENWFENKNYNREAIRKACYDEIDSSWTPDFQIKVIKDVIK